MSLGKKGYEAFCGAHPSACADWNEDLEQADRDAWEAAARAIAGEVYKSVRDAEPIPETQPAPAGYPANIPSEAPTRRTLG